jgi:hypothetical protein
MEEIEGVLGLGSVAGVQVANAGHGGFQDCGVVGPGLARRIGEVAQDGEMQMRFPVGQVLHLEVVESVADCGYAVEQRGDDHRRPQLGRDPVLAQIELGQHMRRQKRRHQLIEHVDRDVVRRNERQQNDCNHGGLARHAGEAEQGGQGEGGAEQHSAHEHEVRVTQDPAVHPFQSGWSVTDGVLERCATLIQQVVPHVRRSFRTHIVSRSPAGKLECESGHRGFVRTGALGDPFHHVPVTVAGSEGHPRVNRIVPQHRFHHALVLDERVPVHAGDGPQAGDAVRHHDLGERDPLSGARRGVLGGHRFVADPALEPGQ